jgi:DNA-binding response OmpR family regulator
MKVLVIEDDRRIASIIRRTLQEVGYVSDHAVNAIEAMNFFTINGYDLVILDLLLPGVAGGGITVCKAIRGLDSNIPILMLTALDAPNDIVKGLNNGADDYMVKPFHLEELLARIGALLRRAPKAQDIVLRIGDVELNTATHHARHKQIDIVLTAKEYTVLEYLMSNKGRVVNQAELIEHAWDSNYQGMSNVVETYIRYLRRKLSPHGEPTVIKTVRGQGYIIET